MKAILHFIVFILLFLVFGSASNLDAHSVQVGYCVSCTGELTLYVEHWHHTEDPSSTTMTLELNINGVISTVTGAPTANLQAISFADLPGCVNPINIFASCPGEANTYNDWAVYTFPTLPCGVPVIITILSGNTAFTEDGCGMYPASTPVITVACSINPPPVATADDTACGSISSNINLTGFVGAIQWQSASSSNGPWTNIPGATSTPLATGTLTTSTFYRALEIGACASNVVSMIVYQAPIANAGNDIISCPSNVPGNLGEASTSGYTYVWSPPTGLSSTSVSNPTVTRTNPVTTTYTVSTSAFGCTSNDVVTVTINPVPISNAGLDITTCWSNILDSIGTANTLGYTYSWSPSTGLNNPAISNPTVALNVSGSTTYVVSTTALTCTSKDTVVVVVNPLPTATIAGATTVCKDAAAPNITLTGAAGTAPYTFTYTVNSGINQTITTITGNNVTIPIPTNVADTFLYVLKNVQDASSTTCSQLQNGNATIIVNPLPTATISGTIVLCKNATAPAITFTGANATAPYTFTYTINGVSQPTVTTISGNDINISAPTTTAGVFIYALVSVKDASSTSCSQAQSGSATVTVNPLPTATITGTTTVCKGDNSPTITFTGAAGTPPYTFTYAINSGANQTISTTSGNSVNISAPTNITGGFTYSLISVQDASSTACSQTQNGSVTIIVNPLPTATITGTTTVCKDEMAPNITFTGAVGTAPFTFTYTVNGVTQPTVTSIGNSTTVAVPTFVVGTFTYSLVSVEDASATACSQAQSGSAIVKVNPLPTATITGTTAVCKNAGSPYITFTGAAGTAPYTFTYTINGGTSQTVITSSGNSVTVPAPTNVVGTFIYDLVSVQDASITACSQQQSGSETIIINPLPIADFNFTDICLTQAMNFVNSSTVSSGTNEGWAWDFGDSSPIDTSENPVYVYANAGTYSVTLITTTNNGCKNTVTKSVVVHPNPNTQFSTANVCDGFFVQFNDLSNIPATDTLQSWAWNFGDGSPLNTNQSVVGGHLYANAATYSVQLLTTSNFGCTDSTTKTVIVNPNPTVLFTANDTAGCELLCISFLDLSYIVSGSIVSWTWDVGDEVFANSSQNIEHCYSNDSVFTPLFYTISLTVTSDSGCISIGSKNNYISVYPNPNANFTVQPEIASIINPVISFTDASAGTNFWNWDFGDLGIETK